MSTPSSVTVRMYNVGFGDCFGLAFHYDNDTLIDTKHIVIDCGSVALPQSRGQARYSLKDVALDISEWCGGSLDAIVATHRHQDHVAGFGGGAGDVFAAMHPALVVQSWTEDPDLPIDADQPLPASVDGAIAFTTALAGQQNFVEFALGALGESQATTPLGYLGQNNIKNRKAVENLIAMGAAGEPEYLSHDQDSKLGDLLPGVTVHVLGPPTIKEWEGITRQRAEDEVEFWHLVGSHAAVSAAGGSASQPIFDHPSFTTKLERIPVDARWVVERLHEVTEEMLRPILRRLDDELNNTSLILLFEVGQGPGRKLLLFPGDAQIENWEQVFEGKRKQRWADLLAEVDVYKVGHHGSLNATPREGLWKRFDKKGPLGKNGRMTSLLSSRGKVHGHAHNDTEVPRRTLRAELDRESDLVESTFTYAKHMAREITIEVGA